ncbi:MAG: YciI family protein [Pseudomonadota bacterium]
MQYLLMIYAAEGTGPAAGSPEEMEMIGEYTELTNEMEAAGVFLGGEPLEPPNTATTVRVRDGKTDITDGPFAETKEVLGGYYLLDCKDLDEALAYAARIPSVRYGSVEVRPVMKLPG